MDEESSLIVNPLALSLDEVIQINKLRNQQKEAEKSTKANGHVEEITTRIQDNIRETPTNGLTVYDRLGWKKPQHPKSLGPRTQAQNQALRAIRNAQVFKNRTDLRIGRNGIGNNRMPPPLTEKVLRRHNSKMTTGNFMIQRSCGPGSVRSMTSTGSRTGFFRHSLKKCLDPNIQSLMSEMLQGQGGKGACVQFGQDGNREEVVDLSVPVDFIQCDSTPVPTYVRFSLSE